LFLQGNLIMMKKTLIALAVLAVSGAAMAQSSVTLYGIADVAVVKDKGESAYMKSGGMSTSRWGVKGSEDLGGGLSATFRFEQGLDLTTGALKSTAAPFNRQANVGLAGAFGAVKFGKVWNAYDDVAGATNPVFDSLLSPMGIAPSYQEYNGNPNNGVYYSSPTFGGVSAAFGTSLKDSAADNLRVTSFNVAYEGGPVYVAFAHEQQATDSADTAKFTRLNASYDLGAAKILAGFGTVKDGADDITVGVDVPLGGALVLSTGFTQVRPDVGDNGNSFALGVNYALSKRTNVYTGFRKDNDAAVSSFGGVESRFALGLRHTF
jgi:predicted porin